MLFVLKILQSLSSGLLLVLIFSSPFRAACSLPTILSSLSNGSVSFNLSSLFQSRSSGLLLSLSFSSSLLSGLPLFSHVLAGLRLVLKFSRPFGAVGALFSNSLSPKP